MFRQVLLIGGVALLVACGGNDNQGSKTPATKEAPTQAKPAFGEWGIDFATFDKDITPGDDFFSYVNGTWLKNTEIPADRSAYGTTSVLREEAEVHVRAIIEDLSAKQSPKGSPEQKVGDYYASWMDTETLNKKGISPLAPDLRRIASIENTTELAREFGSVHYVFGITPISQGLGFDSRDPDYYMFSIGLGGLGLPEKSYYQDETEKFVTIRQAYVAHITEMLGFADIENAEQKARSILELETKIAALQWDRADRRDRDKTTNITKVVDLKEQNSNFDWDAYFAGANARGMTELNVGHPDTLAPLIDLINQEPLATWKDYLTYHMISNNGGVLSEEIDLANFNFWGKIISGREEQRDRWKRGVARIGARTSLGEALGQIYVDRHFSPEAKAKTVELVENMRVAYGERIRDLDWMSEATKTEALAKLAAFRAKVGYPDQWLDLGPIVIEENDLFGNVRRTRKFFEDRDMARLTQKTDKEEWLMTPQTVNAYYLANFNEIVFPAAYLQPPNFDPNVDDAINYGAIGATIGHEMGHGFDDQGSKSDAKGVKRNWWTDEDRARFEARTKILGDQFSRYEPIEGQFIDGAYTMGENIGDLGGLEVAYRAYRLSLGGKPAPIIDGYTGDQRFFLSYAQTWRSKYRDELALYLLKTGPHSPPKYRVNGIVRNMDAWYEAFNVNPDNELYLAPEQRASIW